MDVPSLWYCCDTEGGTFLVYQPEATPPPGFMHHFTSADSALMSCALGQKTSSAQSTVSLKLTDAEMDLEGLLDQNTYQYDPSTPPTGLQDRDPATRCPTDGAERRKRPKRLGKSTDSPDRSHTNPWASRSAGARPLEGFSFVVFCRVPSTCMFAGGGAEKNTCGEQLEDSGRSPITMLLRSHEY